MWVKLGELLKTSLEFVQQPKVSREKIKDKASKCGWMEKLLLVEKRAVQAVFVT